MKACKKPGVFFFIVLLTAVILLAAFAQSCSKKPAKSPAKPSENEKQESLNLKKLQNSVDNLVKEFEKEYLKRQAPPPKPPTQAKPPESEQKQGEQSKSQSSQQGKEQQGGQKSQGQQGGQGQSGQSPEPDWAKFEKEITQIHTQWNSFQPEAVKNGAALEMVDAFSSKLNELTITLTRKELYHGLLAANDLYEKTVSFEKLFKTKSPPDAKKVLCNLRNAAYRALAGEDAEAEKAINDALGVWETVKPQIKDIATVSKVEYSLKELGQAIKERDPNLIKIKAQIAEKNMQDAIKSIEMSQGTVP
ncbi:MAG: hypothetical protein NUV45_01815 [Tepidanaerobacteraceae bacterium]|jgi:hypothetical protein|nr:hypothetical protein [Tepidanaerobacteraceae bacterium]